MLDDLKLIHIRDAKDALGIAQNQWQQYMYDFKLSWTPPNIINKVVFVGMGGSGLAAKAYKDWLGLNVPFEIIQEYDLPNYIDNSTLLIVCSYSGNTEEAITVFHKVTSQSEKADKNPMIVVVTSGGELRNYAEIANIPILLLPTGLQPRMTLGYQLRALCEIFEACNFNKQSLTDIGIASDWLKQKIEQWEPLVKTENNIAKKLALDLIGKSVIIYSSSKFFSVAYKWKINFNENAKMLAWCNQLPEFNHNEFIGWTNMPVEKPFSIIDIRSSLDNLRINKRFDITAQLLSGKRPNPETIELEGESKIQQILWGIALGDFVSIYCAILGGIDPTSVDLIEEFKKRLI